MNNSSIFDYQCLEKSLIRWPQILWVAISDPVISNEFLPINKWTMSSGFQAEVLCGFARGIAGGLAGPQEDQTLTNATDVEPGPAVSLFPWHAWARSSFRQAVWEAKQKRQPFQKPESQGSLSDAVSIWIDLSQDSRARGHIHLAPGSCPETLDKPQASRLISPGSSHFRKEWGHGCTLWLKA